MNGKSRSFFSWLSKKTISLRTAVVLTIVVGVMVPAGIASYHNHQVMKRQFALQMKADLENTGSLLGMSVTTPLWNVAIDDVKFFVSAAFADERIFEIAILSFDGKPFVTQRRPGPEPSHLTTFKTDIIKDSEKLGELVLTMDNEIWDGHLQRLFRQDVETVLKTLLGSLILILVFLQIRFLKPIYRLVNASIAIRNGDFTTSMPIGRQDEIGELASSLETTRKTLSNTFEELENRVAQRTAELSDALSFSKTIILSSPLPMAICTADGRCVEINDAYRKLMYGSGETGLVVNINDTTIWANTEMHSAFEKALTTNTAQMFEAQIMTTLGEKRWLECRVLPVELSREVHALIQLIDLTERKQHEETLKGLAFHDVLTGLPNRRLLLDRISQALHSSKRERSHGAVLFLDLDKFKQLNDNFGHEAGDDMLVLVSKRLKRVTRDTDTVARLGGDEFIVLLEGLGEDYSNATALAEQVAEKIRQVLSEDYLLGEIQYKAGASIGITLFNGDELDAESLIKAADIAMYEEKKTH